MDENKLKSKRKVVRTATTKLLTKIEELLLNEQIEKISLEESINLLKLKSEELNNLNSQIEILTDMESIESEIETSQEYSDKICIFNLEQKQKLMN